MPENINSVEIGAGAYRHLRIPKRKGGFREAFEPNPELKDVQKNLLEHLYGWDVPSCMFGFVRGRSPIQNARVHMQSGMAPRWVFKLDLKDAFPSVTSAFLEKMLKGMFLPKVSDLYAHLNEYEQKKVLDEFVGIVIQLTTLNGRLPQGAPTSPYLFNLALVHSGLTKRLVSIASKHGFEVTIYADDITISSLKRKIESETRKAVLRAIEESGIFKVNPEKISLNNKRSRAPKITGVVLATYRNNAYHKMTLPHQTLKKWRGKINRATAIMRQGIRPNREEHGVTINEVLGGINWIKQVFRGYRISSIVKKKIIEFEEVYQQFKT